MDGLFCLLLNNQRKAWLVSRVGYVHPFPVVLLGFVGIGTHGAACAEDHEMEV